MRNPYRSILPPVFVAWVLAYATGIIIGAIIDRL